MKQKEELFEIAEKTENLDSIWENFTLKIQSMQTRFNSGKMEKKRYKSGNNFDADME